MLYVDCDILGLQHALCRLQQARIATCCLIATSEDRNMLYISCDTVELQNALSRDNILPYNNLPRCGAIEY